MAKYEIPEIDYEGMSPAEANQAIEKIDADVYEDSGHPLYDRTHPQHPALVEHRTNLFKAAARKEGEPLDLGKAKAEQDAVDMAALKQGHLIREAQTEIDGLVALGYDPREVPEDVQPFEVAAWRIQRLAAEGKFQELIPLMEKELVVLDSSQTDLFHSIIQDTKLDPKSRAQHLELILEQSCSKNREIYGVK